MTPSGLCIIGSGYSAAALLLHLEARGAPMHDVTVIGPQVLGAGQAFGCVNEDFRLNVRAELMQVWPDDPGHFANWELMMLGIQRLVGKTGSLYRRANNPYMEAWVIAQRAAFMPVQIPKGSDGARTMIELLKDGTSLGVLIDQKLGTGDPITFMGRETKAPSASIKLARRFDIPCIPTVIRRREDGPDKIHFVQHFYPALDIPKTDNMKADVDHATRQAYDLIEQWIEEKPEEWFWQHNRWK